MATGLTPKVAGIHWDDLLSQFRLKISFQLQTPFGTFPEREEVFFYGDLASVLNAIKAIWAITTQVGIDDGDYVTAPMGLFSILGTNAGGTGERSYQLQAHPPPYAPTLEGPDSMAVYDGAPLSWGETPL